MSNITQPSLYRLARQAGVKTMSSDCTDVLRKLLERRTDEIVKTIIVLNKQSGTKTIMANDVYAGLNIMGINLTKSESMGKTTCSTTGC